MKQIGFGTTGFGEGGYTRSTGVGVRRLALNGKHLTLNGKRLIMATTNG